jgi:hypothetical protein
MKQFGSPFPTTEYSIWKNMEEISKPNPKQQKKENKC